MKKFLYFFIILVFLEMWFVLPSYADWYGLHQESFDHTSIIAGRTEILTNDSRSFCDEDSHPDGQGVLWNNLPSWVRTRATSQAPHFDGDMTPQRGDGVARTWDMPTGTGYYTRQARVVSGNTFSMRCEKWDGTKPWTESISYHNGWTNNQNIVIKIKAHDYGGAFLSNAQITAQWHAKFWIENNKLVLTGDSNVGVSSSGSLDFGLTGPEHISRGVWFAKNSWLPHLIIEMKTSTSGPDFSVASYSDWVAVLEFSKISASIENNTNLTAEYVISAPRTPWTAYKFRYRVVDGAGNMSDWMEWSDTYKLDTEPPKIDNIDMISAHADNDLQARERNFMAGENGPMRVVYKNSDGSPVQITYNIEQDNAPNQRTNKTTNLFEYDFRLPDIFYKVDNDRNNLNGRSIDVRITRIADEAGNVLNIPSPKLFNFTMFANIVDWIVETKTSQVTRVADGSKNIFMTKVVDKYGNLILPSSKIGRIIERKLQTLENKMFLNQQARSGETSVFVNNEPLPFNNSVKNFGPQNVVSDNYQFTIQVYTPTANAYGVLEPISDPEAKFSLISWLEVRDDQTKIKSTNFVKLPNYDINNPIFAPLFINSITWDFRDWGFIEGTIQKNRLSTKQHINSTVNLSPNIVINYSGDDKNSFTLSVPFSRVLIPDSNTLLAPFADQIDFESFLKQKPQAVGNHSKIQLSTHFDYQLDGKKILYNGDIIGKMSYHGTSHDAGVQVGVKILGNANLKHLHVLLEGQTDNLGNPVSTDIATSTRNEVVRSVLLALRNVKKIKTTDNIHSVWSIPGAGNSATSALVSHGATDSILLIEKNDGTVTLSAEEISGRRTVVVRGANLYITKNMFYKDNDSVLGVVVQKNEQWQGGNLYIHPSITNIVGAYVLDGSVINYDGTQEIGIGNIQLLKNQLHIYGMLVAHNTIGWARTLSPFCPSILNISNCSLENAQKYDLNYLRRYYLYNGVPFGWAKVIGGGKINANKRVEGADTRLIQRFNNAMDNLAQYPVIIEHHPLLIHKPPIGLEVYK